MDEICIRMKTSIDMAYQWSRKGFSHWPRAAVKLPNRAWRCRDCDLDAWLQAQPWSKMSEPVSTAAPTR